VCNQINECDTRAELVGVLDQLVEEQEERMPPGNNLKKAEFIRVIGHGWDGLFSMVAKTLRRTGNFRGVTNPDIV
jgi:hypothetical protein